MKKLKFIKNIFTYGQNKILNFSILFFLGCNQAFAMGMDQGGDMPWEGPLQKIMDSLTGPVARILAVLVKNQKILKKNWPEFQNSDRF